MKKKWWQYQSHEIYTSSLYGYVAMGFMCGRITDQNPLVVQILMIMLLFLIVLHLTAGAAGFAWERGFDDAVEWFVEKGHVDRVFLKATRKWKRENAGKEDIASATAAAAILSGGFSPPAGPSGRRPTHHA